MAKVFAAFFKYRDELTYDRNNLNGQAMNLTTMGLQNSYASREHFYVRAIETEPLAKNDLVGKSSCGRSALPTRDQVEWSVPSSQKLTSSPKRTTPRHWAAFF